MGKKKSGGNGEAQPPPQEQSNGGERRPPAHECRIQNIRGVVWENTGDDGRWFSVVISRTYKDAATGNFKSASSFSRNDLLVVAEVARLCWLWIAQQHGTNLGNSPTASEEVPI